MSKVYGYGRVSTDDQSLDVQDAALKAADCNVIMLETASGASREGRPKLQLLLDVMGAGDTLIVTKLDRLARDTVDMLELVREIGAKGAGFKSLAESWATVEPSIGGKISPFAELVLTIMGGVAQFDRARIKERQKEGIAAAKIKGVYKGKPRKHDPAVIRQMRADGKTEGQICEALKCKPRTIYRAMKGNSHAT